MSSSLSRYSHRRVILVSFFLVVATFSSSVQSPAAALPATIAPTMRPQTAPEPSKRIRTSGYYVPGDYTVADLYVSPTGDDTNTGTSSSAPLRTITAAWNKIPTTMTATGYRINLLPGTFPCEPLPEDINNCINYFSDRLSTAQFPIILRALGGTATVRGGLNFNHVSYLYLYDLTLVGGTPLPTNSSGNNLLHLEQGDHVLLVGSGVPPTRVRS